jgi:integrase
MQDVAAGKTALDLKTGKHGRRIVRGGKGVANRCTSLLSNMFALAEEWGYRSAGAGNPCRGVERFDESAGRQRARFLSDAQLARLGAALAAAEAADPRHRMPANIVRLLLLTGARMGEIVGLRREYLDLGRGLIRLPDSKTGAKAIVLSAPARLLLAELVRDGAETGYLFPGPRPARGAPVRPYGGLKGFWAGAREAAKLGDTRIHDLRHSYASVGVAGGSSLLIAGKLLGHAQASTTERYSHLADDPVREAADSIGGRIAAALAGGKSAEVVTLHPGRRQQIKAGSQGPMTPNENALSIISRLNFRFAKTMPQTPHEYTVREPEDEATEADYIALFNTILADGIDERYGRGKKKYLYPGDGWKYWAMTTHLPSSRVLNRQQIEHDVERLRREGQPIRDANGRLSD